LRCVVDDVLESGLWMFLARGTAVFAEAFTTLLADMKIFRTAVSDVTGGREVPN